MRDDRPDQRGFLWVPEPLARTHAAQSETSQSLNTLTLVVTYEHLFGTKPQWSDVTGRLRRYSLGAVLDVLGRISAVLNRVGENAHGAELQLQLIQGVFGGRAADVLDALARFRAEQRAERVGGPMVLFHELQLINLAKVALLELPVSDEMDWESLADLGEALLMINDLTSGEVRAGVGLNSADPNTEEGLRVWHQFLVVNGIFHKHPRQMNAIARAFDLYLTDKPHLAGHPSYVDVPSRIENLTGLSVDALWTALFGFLTYWSRIDPQTIGETPGFINTDTYFTAKLELSSGEVEKFFAVTAADASDLNRAVATAYSLSDLWPYHFLPLAGQPIITIGERAYCPSVQLLFEKATSGLHHIFLDPHQTTKAERNRWFIYMGAVFEDYVDRVFRRAFPPMTGRYLDATVLNRLVSGKSCDGLINYGDAVILFETKAKLLSLAARTGLDWSEYENKLLDVFVGAAQQIDSTIHAIRRGALASEGVDPAIIRAYYPVIVTLEEFTMNRLVYDHIDSVLAGTHALTGQVDVKPFQLITVSELELLEVALSHGRSFRDLLEEKVSAAHTRVASFTNFSISLHEDWVVNPANEYLGVRFHELGERMLAFVRSRAKSAEA
ncbi:MAG: hypothetical protein AVDCRST_MAG68-5431 [uncultured Gemmatimonadetes bacterium]|uniref:Uncharacterized protein n=1 Tax=uncultured Gemmatimonadota bacterium TaxID=203437 RepID=A0A6J4MYG5_9BACT|nr:MAG: hypothetical protein AVDCRST_MAG68-5431 [uncultured Gemmatimonadota bacterium]